MAASDSIDDYAETDVDQKRRKRLTASVFIDDYAEDSGGEGGGGDEDGDGLPSRSDEGE